jgi:hypothetical protein
VREASAVFGRTILGSVGLTIAATFSVTAAMISDDVHFFDGNVQDDIRGRLHVGRNLRRYTFVPILATNALLTRRNGSSRMRDRVCFERGRIELVLLFTVNSGGGSRTGLSCVAESFQE